MNTATFHPDDTVSMSPAGAIVRRFVWKECRVLRGLWLAVAVLGVLVQLTLNFFTPPGLDHAAPVFATALAAAVLYAVGAAATTFSVEHEEETYGFLTGLPTTWWPLLVGKLIVAATSAAALAAVLAAAGWVIGDLKAPTGRDAVTALGLFGVAIVEALAWGTLFSLLTKRPVVAALLTLIVGITATHLAVNVSSPNIAASNNPAAYVAAIPLRMAIVALVLGCTALMARRWLTIGILPLGHGVAGATWRPALVSHVAQRIGQISFRATPGIRRRMLARLMWQTWRDSWKLLPLPIAVAALLFAVASLSTFLMPLRDVGVIAAASTVFFAPALYGALVFSADQRRGSYRFLAEHAAWPRYVWLARHIVWLGAIVILATCGLGVVAGSTFAGLRFIATRLTDNYIHWNEWNFPTARDIAFDFHRNITAATQGAGLAGCGILAAYGIGQFWSMLVRSEITAAFVSLVLSAALAAWVAILFVWQLPGSLFLLPIFAGLMMATWLRAPTWITDRRTWRTWRLPTLALAAPLLLVGLLLPIVRLAQLPTYIRLDNEQWVAPDVAITNQLDWYRHGDSPEARETAAMYERAANLLHSWEDNDLLERWSKPEYMLPPGGDDVGGESAFGIDVSKIPANERAAFRKAVGNWTQLERKATESAIQLVTEASLRPTCRFDFDIGQAQPVRNDWRRQLDLDTAPLYRRMNELLDVILLSPFNPVDSPDHWRVALRMSAHLRSGQPSVVFISQLGREQQILERIGQWAFHDDRTDEQLRETAERLNEYFRTSYLSPDDNLMADHLLVRDVLVGDAYPLALFQWPDDKPAYLAYLANQLSWERVRGLRALNRITLQTMDDAHQLTRYLANQQTRERSNWQLRRWLRPYWFAENWLANWVLEQPAAATSYLTRFEYQARVQVYVLNRATCDAAMYRQAVLLEIALARFRLDHDEYPKSLAQLVPNYLDREPIDPYNGQSFQYAPSGLSLPLYSRGNRPPELGRSEPSTPLFWSVGAGNAQMEKRTSTRLIEGTVDPQGEPLEVRETYFELAGALDEQPWLNEPVFVFPLPK